MTSSLSFLINYKKNGFMLCLLLYDNMMTETTVTVLAAGCRYCKFVLVLLIEGCI